jgi:hypothetical protein
MMKCNVGWLEQVVRLLLGVPTCAAYFYVRHFSPRLSFILLGMGLTLLVTAILRRCPMHHVLGTSTARRPALEPAQATESML